MILSTSSRRVFLPILVIGVLALVAILLWTRQGPPPHRAALACLEELALKGDPLAESADALLGSWGDGALRIWRKGDLEIAEYRAEPTRETSHCPCLGGVEAGVIAVGFDATLSPERVAVLLENQLDGVVVVPEGEPGQFNVFPLRSGPGPRGGRAAATFEVRFVSGSRFLDEGERGDTPFQRLRAAVYSSVAAREAEGIFWAEPNPVFSLSQAPETNHYALEAIGAQKAWGLWEGEPVPTATIDTGLTNVGALDSHLAGMQCVRAGPNGPQFNCSNDPGHGTQMASIIGCPNADSVDRGVAGPEAAEPPDTWLWAIQVDLDANLILDGSELAAAVELIVPGDSAAATDPEGKAAAGLQEVKVVTLAFNGTCPSRLVYESLKKLDDEGVWMFASAGNDGRDIAKTPSYPASFATPTAIQETWPASSLPRDDSGDFETFEPLPHLLPIGSLYSLPASPANRDRMAEIGAPLFDLYPSEASNYSSEPDIVRFWAPGAGVWALHSKLKPADGEGDPAGPWKVQISGTSFAAAHAAGVAAMVLSVDPASDGLEKWLHDGGLPFQVPTGGEALYPDDNKILNACRSLQLAKGEAVDQCSASAPQPAGDSSSMAAQVGPAN